MCMGCFIENGPFELTEAAKAAKALIDKVYEIHLAGGIGHIVFDDWNIEDGNIQWCLSRPEVDQVCKDALEAMLALSMPERQAAMALHWGFINESGEQTEEAL